MYKLFFCKGDVIVYDQAEKDFKHKYGNVYEQIGVVKDDANIAVLAERLKKQYNALSIVYDCHIKRKWGWKYFTEEQKAEYRKKMSEAKRGRHLSDKHKDAISAGKKGKRSNHAGKRHSKDTRDIMSLRALGHKRVTGRRWCHDPITGQEKRVLELPKGFVWGRSPELEVVKNFSIY